MTAEPHGWNKDTIMKCNAQQKIPFVPFLWFETDLHRCPAKLYLGHGVTGLSKSYEHFDFLMVVKDIYWRRPFSLQRFTNGEKTCTEPILHNLCHPDNTVLNIGEGKMIDFSQILSCANFMK